MAGHDLWASSRAKTSAAVAPLALRMRPRTLDEVGGQRHILDDGKLLRRMLSGGTLTSVIFHGPPGTGKTTLAEVIAAHTDRYFFKENAAGVGVKRIREIIDDAERFLHESNKRSILFLDEIHRFTKSQQDVLLADVERGVITLIGATTENPLFAVNSALVSRSTLFRLEPLSEEDVVALLERAIADTDRGVGGRGVTYDTDALSVWAVKSDGDARRALTALEVAVLSSPEGVHIDRALAEESIQQKAVVYDHTGDEHYDSISAMIKSVRGSDPDAAVFWIARMLDAGEDPRFIARRLAVLASEDIGNADPRAIMVASATWELVERIGMPECRITLSQCACYLALAPKSNASYRAIDAALADVKSGRTRPVPIYLRDKNAPPAADGSAHGKGYRYTHEGDLIVEGFGPVGEQEYIGVSEHYYKPLPYGAEKLLAERLEAIKKVRSQEP